MATGPENISKILEESIQHTINDTEYVNSGGLNTDHKAAEKFRGRPDNESADTGIDGGD